MNREHKLYGVRALYPRLNQPYHFDATANKSMPCSYDTPEAKYECSFIINADQAKDVIKNSIETFKIAAKPNWQPWAPKSIEEVFNADPESDNFILKSVKKTYGEDGKAPIQWLADSSLAPSGFMLTTGSICHAVLTLAPWNYAGKAGVQFRLKGIMVTELADAPTMDNPFVDDPNANVDGSIDAELDSLMNDLAGKQAPTPDAPFADDIPF